MKTIERVRLSQIKPNESNPRADFGDIAALADSIRATGGEPVNPIVCVRDGGCLFVVDGERRLRAMRELHGDGDPEVSAVVVDGWDEGNEVLAMLATDNKLRLSEQEMGRGYQLAFDLGVDYLNDTQIAMGTGADVDTVARGRMAWEDLGRKAREAYAQLSLDQLAAAQEFVGKDREAVLKARPDAWRSKVSSIRERNRLAEMDAAAADACARAGIEWIAGKGIPDGLVEIRSYWTMDDGHLAALEADIAETGATALLMRGRGWRGRYALLHPASEDERRESEERRRKRLDAERMEAVAGEFVCRAAAHFAALPKSRSKAMRRAAASSRSTYFISASAELLERAGADRDDAERILAEPASGFEVIRWLDAKLASNPAPWFPAVLAAAREDGYEPTEGDEWLEAHIEGMRGGGDGTD